MAGDRLIAPYAPLANVLTVIRRIRERGIPQPVTRESLALLGVPDGNAPRTLQALKFLGLVTEDGGLTSGAERLRKATTEEYPVVLSEIVQEAYAPVFAVVDPATATEVRVGDAFRQYEPATQRGRMVVLFLGLCAEAGLVAERAQRAPRAHRDASPRRAPVKSVSPQGQTIRSTGIPSGEVVGTPLFGVREEDIALLDDAEFKEVWDALGTVARARARARRERPSFDPFQGFFGGAAPTKNAEAEE